MMDSLLLHKKTYDQAQRLLARPPHAALITGLPGSGRHITAFALAAEILGLTDNKLMSYPYFKELTADRAGIGIDEIRSLQQFLKLKVPTQDKSIIRRIVKVHEAERMRHEAQNALLKTLEEPPLDTQLILTASHEHALLPTIVSRASKLEILPVSLASATAYFTPKNIKPAKISEFYALSQGQAGLLFALLHDASHPLVEAVKEAKHLMSAKPADRLLETDALAKDKEHIKYLLDALQRITHAAITSASQNGRTAAVKQWHNKQAAVLKSNELFKFNPNPKLFLDDLLLSI